MFYVVKIGDILEMDTDWEKVCDLLQKFDKEDFYIWKFQTENQAIKKLKELKKNNKKVLTNTLLYGNI